MGAISRTGIVYVIYNLDYKNLGYKIYTIILKNNMQKTLDAIIGENQSAVIKNRTMLHTFSTIRDIIDVSYKLKSNLALIYFNFVNLLQIRLGFHTFRTFRKFVLSQVCSS